MIRVQTIANMHDVSLWSAMNADVTSLVPSNISVTGGGVAFAKTNGAANSTVAGIYREFDSFKQARLFSVHDRVCWLLHISAATDVANSFLRLGTDANNYLEWRFADSSLNAAQFTLASAKLGEAYVTGEGWNQAAIKYCAVGLTMDAETNALADIVVDSVYLTNALFTN